MMRAQFMRASSAAVLALLIGATGPLLAGQALAQQAVRPSLPDGADEAALGQMLTLPALPPAVVQLDVDREPTGSLDLPPKPSAFPSQPAAAALPFDAAEPHTDVPPAVGPASSAPGGDTPKAAEIPAPPAPAPAATAVAPAEQPAPPIAAAMPNGTTSSAPAAAAPTPPPAATPAVAEAPAPATAGLDAATLAAAFSAFTTDLPAGEGTAQQAERRAQRDAIVAFYADHANAPLWVSGDQLNPAALSVMTRLAHAADDGLDLARFPTAAPQDTTPATLARTELALSEAVLAYARQASGSRVNPARVGALIDYRPDVPDAARVLGSVPTAADAGDALRAFNPPEPGYTALRDKLAEIRQSRADVSLSRIPAGPVLKSGMSDKRVPLLRARFGLDIADDADDTLVYGDDLAAAVAAYQKKHRLPVSGQLNPRTIAALSNGGASPDMEADLLANMEMWRWMPREQAPDRIEVNVPEFKVRVMRDGAVAHETRVVVGQPGKPTPLFANTMRFIIVNPYWNVPLSIIKNEMMPKLAADPNYFANHGYEVVERNGTTFVRQPPGEENALGRIKFMFPNDHAVYLHDTNAKSYFSRDKRALSHGCVRVEEPFSFAEAVMGRENGWPESRIVKMIGGNERAINLPKPLPILITYFTVIPDGVGSLTTRDDVYGYMGKMKAALGLLTVARAPDVRSVKHAATEAVLR